VLTLLSYAFYGWANPLFVVLMMTSTLIDYCCGLVIAQQWGGAWKQPVEQLDPEGRRTRSQRIALIISICSNLSLLGVLQVL
jgi:alginate O-acetyltransferase complex protein AlgI